jgi:Arc/MetJ-type ribon-helix-helix transcriptional regulator
MPPQDQKMQKVTISLPEKQLEKVDKFVETGEYPSRSDVVRAAIREFKVPAGVPA